MKRYLQILALHAAIIAVNLPLRFASGSTWRLEGVRSRLQTQLDNLKAADE